MFQVIRQNEPELIKTIHELSNGEPSQETEDLLCSLKRPLPEDSNPVYIFGTNQDCDYLNELKLDKLPTETHEYAAIDDG